MPSFGKMLIYCISNIRIIQLINGRILKMHSRNRTDAKMIKMYVQKSDMTSINSGEYLSIHSDFDFEDFK